MPHIDLETIEALPATEMSVRNAVACASMAELVIDSINNDIGGLNGSVAAALEAARALQVAVEKVQSEFQRLLAVCDACDG